VADDLSKENAELVESLSTYVANLARLPVGRFAEADAINILNAVRSSEANSEKRLLLPGLLTMVDIRLQDNVFYVSGKLPAGDSRLAAQEPSTENELARLEGCFNRPASIN
jgi:hypothetical protein